MKARVRTGWDKLRLEMSIAWDEWKDKPLKGKAQSAIIIIEATIISVLGIICALRGADLLKNAVLSDGEKAILLLLAAVALGWFATLPIRHFKKEK